MAIIEYKTNKLTLIKLFSRPILAIFCSAKLGMCNAACAHIVTDLMTKLKYLTTTPCSWMMDQMMTNLKTKALTSKMTS